MSHHLLNRVLGDCKATSAIVSYPLSFMHCCVVGFTPASLSNCRHTSGSSMSFGIFSSDCPCSDCPCLCGLPCDDGQGKDDTPICHQVGGAKIVKFQKAKQLCHCHCKSTEKICKSREYRKSRKDCKSRESANPEKAQRTKMASAREDHRSWNWKSTLLPYPFLEEVTIGRLFLSVLLPDFFKHWFWHVL